MRFLDIVQDSEGYLSPYKDLSHLYRKCGHDGVKPEVRFRKSAKVVCPTVNLKITSNKHFHRLLTYFHGHLGMAVGILLLCALELELCLGGQITSHLPANVVKNRCRDKS